MTKPDAATDLEKFQSELVVSDQLKAQLLNEIQEHVSLNISDTEAEYFMIRAEGHIGNRTSTLLLIIQSRPVGSDNKTDHEEWMDHQKQIESRLDLYLLGLSQMTIKVTSTSLESPFFEGYKFSKISERDLNKIIPKTQNDQIDAQLFTYKFCENTEHIACFGNSLYFFDHQDGGANNTTGKKQNLYATLGEFSQSLYHKDVPLFDFEMFAGDLIEKEWTRLLLQDQQPDLWSWDFQSEEVEASKLTEETKQPAQYQMDPPKDPYQSKPMEQTAKNVETIGLTRKPRAPSKEHFAAQHDPRHIARSKSKHPDPHNQQQRQGQATLVYQGVGQQPGYQQGKRDLSKNQYKPVTGNTKPGWY